MGLMQMLDLWHEAETILAHLECRILTCPFVAFLPVVFIDRALRDRLPDVMTKLIGTPQREVSSFSWKWMDTVPVPWVSVPWVNAARKNCNDFELSLV